MLPGDASPQTKALAEMQGTPLPQDPGDKPVQKVRIAYLDHVKLLCMCSVWWIHAMAYAVKYCQEKDHEPWPGSGPMHGKGYGWESAPLWNEQLFKMLHKYNMCFFAMCSGAVSKYEPTAEQLQGSFTSLILPCVFFHLWYQFCWYYPSGRDLNLFGFITNTEPWYMKTLFAWRILLNSLGYMSDWALLGIAFGARTALAMGGLPFWDMGGHVIYDAPYFVLGHILVRRRKLLEPYVAFLNNHLWLRVACFVGYVLLWVDALTIDLNGQFNDWFFGLIPDEGFVWKALHDWFWFLQSLCYGFVATGWLPTNHMAIWSETGKWTLYAYLQNYEGILVALHVWRAAIPRWSSTFWWWTWMTMMPFLTAALCSEPVRFLLWPIAQPSWFGKDPREWQFDKLCDVDLAKKVGFKVWAGVEVAFHVVWMGALAMLGPPQCS